jgi:hypothetical protein
LHTPSCKTGDNHLGSYDQWIFEHLPNGVKALKDLSLTIGNHMFGLLGRTAPVRGPWMRTVGTLQDPDSGTVRLGWITHPTQTFTITVDQPPTRAGIDPYNKLIDRNADDNIMDISKP